MVQSVRDQIINAINDIVSQQPLGVQYSDLAQRVREHFKNTEIADSVKSGKLHPFLCQYVVQPDATVYRAAKGIYRHIQFKEKVEAAEFAPESPAEKIHEHEFYKPFADWLVGDVEECTRAIPVGGNKLKEKWGTPDVIGILRRRHDDIIDVPTEIVSAEIKVSPDGLITAFGQACSYKLFSHKSYIVVPQTAQLEDKTKLESLCLILGIGLVLFDPSSPQNPNFQIRTRAMKHDPDMSSVSDKLRPIGKELLE